MGHCPVVLTILWLAAGLLSYQGYRLKTFFDCTTLIGLDETTQTEPGTTFASFPKLFVYLIARVAFNALRLICRGYQTFWIGSFAVCGSRGCHTNSPSTRLILPSSVLVHRHYFFDGLVLSIQWVSRVDSSCCEMHIFWPTRSASYSRPCDSTGWVTKGAAGSTAPHDTESTS